MGSGFGLIGTRLGLPLFIGIVSEPNALIPNLLGVERKLSELKANLVTEICFKQREITTGFAELLLLQLQRAWAF